MDLRSGQKSGLRALGIAGAFEVAVGFTFQGQAQSQPNAPMRIARVVVHTAAGALVVGRGAALVATAGVEARTASGLDDANFGIDLRKVSPDVERISLIMMLDTPMASGTQCHVRLLLDLRVVARCRFDDDAFKGQTGLILLELYRSNEWRIGVVAQGFASTAKLAADMSIRPEALSPPPRPTLDLPPPPKPIHAPPQHAPPTTHDDPLEMSLGNSALTAASPRRALSLRRTSAGRGVDTLAFTVQGAAPFGCLYELRHQTDGGSEAAFRQVGCIHPSSGRNGTSATPPHLLLEARPAGPLTLVSSRPETIERLVVFVVDPAVGQSPSRAARLTDSTGETLDISLPPNDPDRPIRVVATVLRRSGGVEIASPGLLFSRLSECAEAFGIRLRWSEAT